MTQCGDVSYDMGMTTTDHRHHTDQPLAILNADGTVTENDPKCLECGRSMREIRAERDAKIRAPRPKRVDYRTPVQKECDNERRRERYRRTGK